MVIVTPPVYEESVIADRVYGECGPALTWTLDKYGQLTISGHGPMDNFAGGNITMGLDSIKVDEDGHVSVPQGSCPWDVYKYGICKVTIESGVTTIGANAFSRCGYLYAVDIPETVVLIGEYAFGDGLGGSDSLRSIDIPGSVREIGAYAFKNCYYLEPQLHSGLVIIGESAFSGCGLFAWTDIVIPDTVTTIREDAFAACLNVESLYIPASVTYIGERAFSGCGGRSTGHRYEPIQIDENNPNYKMVDGSIYTMDGTVLLHHTSTYGNDEVCVIPDGVIRIASEAFVGGQLYQKIILPESLKEIGYAAISGDCAYEIFVPSGVEKIGDQAFARNFYLKKLHCSSPLTTLPYAMFAQCVELEEFTIPDGVEFIDDHVFSSCSALKTVTIPQSVRAIGIAAFHLTALENVIYEGTPEQWAQIFIFPSEGNEPLLSANITFSENSADNNPTSLIVEMEKQPYMGSGFFQYRINEGSWMRGVYCKPIDVSVGDQISFRPFPDFDSFFQNWSTADQTFYKQELSLTITGNTLLHVRFDKTAYLLNYCIFLPSNLRSLGEGAFAGTAFNALDIPKNVERIVSRAFAETNIHTLVFENGYVELEEDALDGLDRSSLIVFAEAGTPLFELLTDQGYYVNAK